MGDGLNLSKDKRHRSSSSIAGAGLDGTRSERKLEIKGLIPEDDDHFAVAESRCDALQESIIKLIKRKKKLSKRSATRVNEAPTVSENTPFISVRTQPKKKVSPQGARMRRLEASSGPVRGYIDPATIEQHRMLGQNVFPSDPKPYSRMRPRRNRADGDGMCGPVLGNASSPIEVACGLDDGSVDSDIEIYPRPEDVCRVPADIAKKGKNVTKEVISGMNTIESANFVRNRTNWKNQNVKPLNPRRRQENAFQHQLRNQEQYNGPKPRMEERPVVELFNKNRSKFPSPHTARPVRPPSRKEDKRTAKNGEAGDQNELNNTASHNSSVRSVKKAKLVCRKIRKRNYELPTVASQLKQVDARYHFSVANRSNIPFVVSKSTAPSHNIGVNIQQVLNGMKIQQPVNGIPMTMAHHMGLAHVTASKKNNFCLQKSLRKGSLNVINVGRRRLTLPSARSISYNRLLSMYAEGDGMVPRFLKSISRPNYIYTSMYDLSQLDEVDGASTSKGRIGERLGPVSVDDDTKRRLAEYADVYAEYEKMETLRKQGGPECAEVEQKCDELLRELLAREEVIKQLMNNGSAAGMSNGDMNELRFPTAVLNEARRTKRELP